MRMMLTASIPHEPFSRAGLDQLGKKWG